MKNASMMQVDDPVTRAMGERPGMWIAWNKEHRTVIAITDTYGEALRQATDSGESDPEIEKAPGIHPAVAARPFTLLEDESPKVIDDVKRIIPNADEWLATPNINLSFEKPQDLINTDAEHHLRYLLRGIRTGITS